MIATIKDLPEYGADDAETPLLRLGRQGARLTVIVTSRDRQGALLPTSSLPDESGS
jgi:hypothetical protein